MPEYQLELKQLVDYPRCRIYRKFIQSLIADRSFHSRGGSGLFIISSFVPSPISVLPISASSVHHILSTPANGSAPSPT